MPLNFDEDPLGAILEYAAIRKRFEGAARTAEKIAWEQENIKDIDLHILQPWNGPEGSVTKGQMCQILEPGRAKDQVRQCLDWVFRTLEARQLLVPYSRDANLNTEYRELSNLGYEIIETGSHEEFIYGGTKIVQRWRNSVVRIMNSDGDGIGTGFVVRSDLIATACHVIDQMPRFVVQSETGDNFEHEDVIKHSRDTVDLALIKLKQVVETRCFRISSEYDVLDPVVVFGYPPIPRTKDAYLVVSKGEISAKPTLYQDDQTMLVVSCLLRGGYSGGPVVNNRGAVVGIVSEQLFKLVSPDEKSINESLGFAAATEGELLNEFILQSGAYRDRE